MAKSSWRERGIAGLVVLILATVLLIAYLLRTWNAGTGGLVELSERLIPKPVAVAPGVYLLGKSSPAAVYAVETSQGLVLVDSGLQADAEEVLTQLSELRLKVGALQAILLTHVHADHSLGAGRLRDLSNARIYAGKSDCQPLREGGPREAFLSTFHLPGLVMHPTKIDVELAGSEVLDFGDARFEVLASPGHTPGSICYLLHRNGRRILFTGDVIQSLNPATPNAIGSYVAYLPPLYRGDARDYLATLRRLRDLPLPDLVLPGHPRMDQTPQAPCLSMQSWHRLLDQGIHRMEKLVACLEADGADYLDGHPKELLPGLHYLGDIGGVCTYGLLSPRGLLLFNAPGGPALIGMLAARLKDVGWQERKVAAVILTSADQEVMSGLEALVKEHRCTVVAPDAGLDAVRQACPAVAEIIGAEEFETRGWLDVKAIALAGRGLTPVAYQIRWASKTVLISGRIPTKLGVPSVEQLLRDVGGPGGNALEYRKSLERLREVSPDLWLPAFSVHGQNANLYDREWQEVLDANRDAF